MSELEPTRTYSNPTANDILRRMLDERGVEYFKHEDGEPLRKLEKADEPATSWHMGGASVCAVPIEGSDLFDLWIDHCTPEQAIAATLGDTDATGERQADAGTCHEIEDEDTGFIVCSECGAVHDESYTAYYCWCCGRRVEQ